MATRRPSGLPPFDQRINQQAEGQGQKDDAADIEPLRPRLPRVAEEEQATNESGKADRHVDEEDRLPGKSEGLR
jgi:hypothetical protein